MGVFRSVGNQLWQVHLLWYHSDFPFLDPTKINLSYNHMDDLYYSIKLHPCANRNPEEVWHACVCINHCTTSVALVLQIYFPVTRDNAYRQIQIVYWFVYVYAGPPLIPGHLQGPGIEVVCFQTKACYNAYHIPYIAGYFRMVEIFVYFVLKHISYEN